MLPTPLERFRSSFDTISLLTGEEFFQQLVSQISTTLEVDTVWMAEYHAPQSAMETIAFLHKGTYMHNMTYLIEGTPCESIVLSDEMVHYPRCIQELFPSSHAMLAKFSSESYVGASLHDSSGAVIGSLVVLHSKPLLLTDAVHKILLTIKSRAESELKRLRNEREIRLRQNQLVALINGVQDLLINLNKHGQVMMANATAESLLQAELSSMVGKPIAAFITDASKSRLLTTIEHLSKSHQRYAWIEGDIELVSAMADTFTVQGTLSRYELDGETYYTLVLRKKQEKKGNDKAFDLIDRTEHLGEKLEELQHFSQLIGESQVMKGCFRIFIWWRIPMPQC